ncbi:MAG: hypothetical protein NTX38_01025, partial [Methylobacter sp.]|nr:hypothetical protein [Methylobacter sp.]
LRLARQKWAIREMIWHMWAMNTPADQFNMTPKDIFILPWDEEDPPRKEYTTEELEDINKRFDKAASK